MDLAKGRGVRPPFLSTFQFICEGVCLVCGYLPFFVHNFCSSVPWAWSLERKKKSRQSGHWLVSRTTFIPIQRLDVTHRNRHVHQSCTQIHAQKQRSVIFEVSAQLSLPYLNFYLSFTIGYYLTNYARTHCCYGRKAWCNSGAISPPPSTPPSSPTPPASLPGEMKGCRKVRDL